MKVVINKCYGGFSLSVEGEREYLNGKFTDEETLYKSDGSGYWNSRTLERNDPVLVAVVKKLGKKASGSCANLIVVEIPDGVNYEIEEYDGMEWVAEKHRTWG